MALNTELNALFVVNQIVNTVFIIDIIFQFFIPVPDHRPENEGEMIHDHKIIAKTYLKGWFILDVVSVLPFDILTIASPGLIPPGPASKSFKLIRILRLIKLMRVLRASRIIQRWENSISISYSSRSLGGAMVGILVLLHWLTCFWALLPQLQGEFRNATGLTDAVDACFDAPESCVWPGWSEVHGACTGCDTFDPSTHHICASPCLTHCERGVYAMLNGFINGFISWFTTCARVKPSCSCGGGFASRG